MTDVGVQYILMEKVEGIELDHRYKNLRHDGIDPSEQHKVGICVSPILSGWQPISKMSS
jgi:hypothetical protein